MCVTACGLSYLDEILLRPLLQYSRGADHQGPCSWPVMWVTIYEFPCTCSYSCTVGNAKPTYYFNILMFVQNKWFLLDHNWMPLTLMYVIMTWFILFDQDPILLLSIYNVPGMLTSKLPFLGLLMHIIYLSGFLCIKQG